MVVGYGGRKIVMENTDTSYYGRILIKALSTYYPDNYYILYSPKQSSSRNKRMTELYNDKSVRVKFPRSYIHYKTRWYFNNGIVKSAKAHGVNTFHGIDDGIASGFAGSSFPTVFTMTDPLYKSAKNWADRMYMQRRARKSCKIAKRVIALNEEDRQIIIDHYHVNPDNVEVVHPCYFAGCDDSVPENMFEIIREKYHLPEKFILYKGRLDKDDNLKEAMQLIHELRNRKISIVMLGYRTTHFDNVVKEQAHDLHIFHRLRWPRPSSSPTLIAFATTTRLSMPSVAALWSSARIRPRLASSVATAPSTMTTLAMEPISSAKSWRTRTSAKLCSKLLARIPSVSLARSWPIT